MGIFSRLKKRSNENAERFNQDNISSAKKNVELLCDVAKVFSFFDTPIYRSYVVKHLTGKQRLSTDNEQNGKVLEELFSRYSNYSEKKINLIIFYLIHKGFLRVKKKGSNYQLFRTSVEAKLDCFNQVKEIDTFHYPKSIPMFLEQHIELEMMSKSSNSKKTVQHIDLDVQERQLFEILKAYRKRVSKEKHLRPYLVFSNELLQRISTVKPTSIEALKRIKGLGERKIGLYGNEVIAIIDDFKKKNEKIYSVDNIPDSLEEYSYVSRKLMTELFNDYHDGKLKVSENNKKYFDSISEFEKYIKSHNQLFVNRALNEHEEYLDNILKAVDSKIKLDTKQREVVLRDEDYTLVVAGAGAGKTTTVAAKVKYLVDKKQVDPSKILIVSYTNDAVNELKTRINHELDITASITTFHKVGYAVVRKHKNMDKTQVIREGLMFNVIRDYLKNQMIQHPEDLSNLVLFFGYYIDYQLGLETIEKFRLQHGRNDYTTLKANLEEMNQIIIKEKQKKKRSIKDEVLRSIEEVQIANYLFLHQIEYEYEASYPYHITESSQLYTPDFTLIQGDKKIYLEHFGISEKGTHSRYSEDEIKVYRQAIKTKINLHKSKGTKLIYTYSEYNDGRPMLDHLKEELLKVGIQPIQRSLIDVYYQLKRDDDSKYLTKFTFLVKDFIQSFKINGYTEKDFKSLEAKTNNVRNRMFLKLVRPIYFHYQQFLQENNMIDFEDMINDSAQILQDSKTKQLIPDFEYVIVDEYQDISQQRFDLTKELSKLTNAKIMAVGDDWQSIFAFAGSRIDLFVNFKNIMGYADYLNIDYTYRNAQEIIDIAGNFIQKNDMQLKKRLKSPKRIAKPIVLYEYSDIAYKNEKKGIKGIIHEKAKICNEIIGNILKVHPEESQIALLGRYNFEHKQLIESEFFRGNDSSNGKTIYSINYPKAKLVFMTVHASKGLGFDNVILLNGSDEAFGFPAQLEMDPLLRLVRYDDRSYSYAEERRLFYVALTRTKNRVFILYPKTKPSVFVRELANDYDLVVNRGKIDQNVPLQDRKEKLCPCCQYPLQFKHNKAYGLKLYMCTNEPELCDYMTNNLRSGKQSIRKCDTCKDGFLIVKQTRKDERFFFGCTNYKENRQGCNNALSIED